MIRAAIVGLGRWGRHLPFKAGRAPRIATGALPVQQRPAEVKQRQQVASRKDCGAGRREHVQHLEFRWIVMIAPRHAEPPQIELGSEGQIEPEENRDGGEPAP